MNYGKFNIISPDKLLEKIKRGDGVFIIDTMTPGHYDKVHIPDSINACVLEVVFIDKIKSTIQSRGAEIIVYGSSESTMDALMAAEKLEDAGYENVSILSGGLNHYRMSGCPLSGNEINVEDDPGNLVKLKDGKYNIDTEESTIKWTGRNPGSSHFGNIKLSGGKLKIKGNDIKGAFTIDMNSISTMDLKDNELEPVLISHLKSDDFFFTKLFPKAVFKIEEAVPVTEPYLSIPNYNISGFLELRGMKLRLDFNANVVQNSDGQILAEAHFDFDRTKWGIVYGSSRFFDFLDMHIVADMISLELRIKTK